MWYLHEATEWSVEFPHSSQIRGYYGLVVETGGKPTQLMGPGSPLAIAVHWFEWSNLSETVNCEAQGDQETVDGTDFPIKGCPGATGKDGRSWSSCSIDFEKCKFSWTCRRGAVEKGTGFEWVQYSNDPDFVRDLNDFCELEKNSRSSQDFDNADGELKTCDHCRKSESFSSGDVDMSASFSFCVKKFVNKDENVQSHSVSEPDFWMDTSVFVWPDLDEALDEERSKWTSMRRPNHSNPSNISTWMIFNMVIRKKTYEWPCRRRPLSQKEQFHVLCSCQF